MIKWLALFQGSVDGKARRVAFVYDCADETSVTEARRLLLRSCGDTVFDHDPYAYVVPCIDCSCGVPHEIGERINISIEAKR